MVRTLEEEVRLRLRLVPLSGLDHDGQAATRLEWQNRGSSEPSVGRASAERPAADDSRAGMALAVIATDEHVAARPSWDCRACGKPWPCDPARERLASEMDRTSLAMFMWANLEEAAHDMPTGPPSELFERFIRWTH